MGCIEHKRLELLNKHHQKNGEKHNFNYFQQDQTHLYAHDQKFKPRLYHYIDLTFKHNNQYIFYNNA